MSEISFYKPSIGDRERELISEALSNPNSQMVERLEEKLREYFGVKHVISTNNSAAAHHLSLCAMDIKRGDKFICSVNAFPSIAQAIRHFDAEPIFVDIDEDDLGICPKALEITLEKFNHKKLKGIFLNHVAGQSAELDKIYDIAKQYKIEVLDSANRAIGLTYNGQKIGNTGSLLTCFQTYSQVKDSVATAGFITTNNDEIAKKAELLRNYAITTGFDKFGNLSYIYDVVDIGVKYDLTAIDAAYSLAQIEKNDVIIKRHQDIAAYYDEQLKDCPHVSTPVKKRDHIYTQYIIKIDKNRDGFARELLEKGINTSLHYIPIHLLSYYKNKYALKVNAFPIALKTYQQILSLPIYNVMSDADVERVAKEIKTIAHSRV
ncbi:DegT/DnrJ/EryC1/StrS family aminotransferase [Campylobacter suis]|uniref:UDP-4-amino-4-deoxy-L-arabinose--oxoglutarate aminotransferase n=1 Tax=Campylobacter suis TaxID=2790657 RepID=A0ABM8Q1I7_9BACT|nr:aminotransferase class I/II-fold pyridoxal phosphate-dependent enzyme [Campylobacter suis]CAD7286681.1 UDP-4-amino-4-deoxy-L-arabinose--oxoglutarate aminotransferase [Campylobacter suis]